MTKILRINVIIKAKIFFDFKQMISKIQESKN